MIWQVVRDAADVDRLIADASRQPVFAVTAPGAAGSLGPKFLRALCAPLQGHSHITPVIDCSDDPGLALRALNLGWRHILFSGPPDLFDKVRTVAASLNAVVYPAETGRLPLP